MELYNDTYMYALYLEPNFAIPNDTLLYQLLVEQFPGIMDDTDFYIHSTGLVLPVNGERGLIEPFHYFKYSYFNNKNQVTIHCPIVEVW